MLTICNGKFTRKFWESLENGFSFETEGKNTSEAAMIAGIIRCGITAIKQGEFHTYTEYLLFIDTILELGKTIEQSENYAIKEAAKHGQ
jgi:hypothetical protein